MLARAFPNVESYFQAADIIAQVLNFGLPAAIDVQIMGNDLQSDYRIATVARDWIPLSIRACETTTEIDRSPGVAAVALVSATSSVMVPGPG